MKIGILGTRGIPNAYGGYEQFAEYFSAGLVERGHEVWVYNSHTHPYKSSTWNGVNIIHCTDLENKIGTAGQFIYDYNCFKDSRKRNFDVLLQLGYTSSSIWHFLWPDTINIINMDGLEWKRSKYNLLTRKFLKWAEKLAVKHADQLIADSIGIQQYLASEYGVDSVYIPYGSEDVKKADENLLQTYGLTANQYFLIIARIEPENNIEMIIKGYLKSAHPFPLVIVGNPENKFGKYLKQRFISDKIRFIGAIYNKEVVNALRVFSTLYFHGHSVGGTNPSLLEAMGSRCIISAHNNIFNKSILTDFATYFSNDTEVAEIIKSGTDGAIKENWKQKNVEKVRLIYNWEKIIDSYENVLRHSIKRTDRK